MIAIFRLELRLSQRLYRVALCLMLAMLACISAAHDADAARRREWRKRYAPPFSAMAIDVHTGRILYAKNANEPRFPASITKVMTLYLLFDALRDGKLTMKSELKVSSHAASQAPSKLYLEAGDTITVSDAIGALVTKSANDVAVVVAEALAPSEGEFARLMTQKARTIGMLNTTFRNASGLPHPEQRTTAQDLIVMARHILSDHTGFCKYFNMRYFNYNGDVYRNHNSLLFSYYGMEGMKTGFTNASGFNLIATAQRNDKRVLAVVLGGPSSRARNATMKNLLDASWSKALTQVAARKAGVLVATLKKRQEPTPIEPAVAIAPAPVKEKPLQLASTAQSTSPISQLRAKPDSRSSAILHSALETGLKSQRVNVGIVAAAKPAGTSKRTRSEAERRKAQPQSSEDMMTDQAEEGEEAASVAALNEPEPSTAASETAADLQLASLTGLPMVENAINVSVHYKTVAGRSEMALMKAAVEQTAEAEQNKSGSTKSILTAANDENDRPQTLAAATAALSKSMDQPGPYHVQVGAFANQTLAEERLEDVSEILGDKTLKQHPKFTMPVSIPSGTMYRARLARFQESQAKTACGKLKRKAIECLVIRVQ